MKYLAVIVFLFFIGCSSSIETTKQTTETVEIQPIKVKPPIIRYQQQLPLANPDTSLRSPYGEYRSIDTIEVKTPEGEKSKAVIKTKAVLKKNKEGKPVLETHSVVEQDSFQVAGRVVSKKEVTDTQKKTVGFWESLSNFLKEIKSIIIWLIVGVVILIILGVIAKVKGFLPFWR